MTFTLRWINRAIGLTLLAAAVALTSGLAIVLIAIQLMGEDVLIERAKCHLGLSEDCIRQELEESKRELERQRREGERLRGRIADMQSILDRLRALDHAASSYVIFYNDHSGPLEVVTGHRYASLLDPGTLTAGWCYIKIDQGAVLSASLQLASFDADFVLKEREFSAGDLRIAKLSGRTVAKARARCKWPEGVS